MRIPHAHAGFQLGDRCFEALVGSEFHLERGQALTHRSGVILARLGKTSRFGQDPDQRFFSAHG